jgi:thiamine kinase-like enzyme
VSVQPLEGGITNRNFLVQPGPLVLRLGGENTQLLGIDRELEHTVTAWAAQAGLGAELICCEPSQDLLVTRFITGKTLTSSDAADPEVLRELAALLRLLHQGPALPGSFSPFQVARTYHQSAVDRGVDFPESLPEVWRRMELLELSLQGGAVCCCHNDLLGANFIHDGQGWRLLDWEYAAMGDPFFDLGNFAVNQGLDEEGCRILLREYFGEFRPADGERLQKMRLASDLREAFWGFLQSGISTIDFDFRGYGQRHLERFLAHSP